MGKADRRRPNYRATAKVRQRGRQGAPQCLHLEARSGNLVPLGGSASPPAAISANRASAGKDFDPVRLMILMRWFSTVRWLDAEVRSDVLAGVAGENHLHHLYLALRKTRQMGRGDSRHSSALFEVRERSSAPDRGSRSVPRGRSASSMKSVAPALMASTAMATSLSPVIMIAGR